MSCVFPTLVSPTTTKDMGEYLPLLLIVYTKLLKLVVFKEEPSVIFRQRKNYILVQLILFEAIISDNPI